jgi:hypothetical protein
MCVAHRCFGELGTRLAFCCGDEGGDEVGEAFKFFVPILICASNTGLVAGAVN